MCTGRMSLARLTRVKGDGDDVENESHEAMIYMKEFSTMHACYSGRTLREQSTVRQMITQYPLAILDRPQTNNVLQVVGVITTGYASIP